MPTVLCLRRGACFALLSFTFTAAFAATDEQRIIRLEQDVRKLERIVQDQARQIEDLRRQLREPGAPALSSEAPATAATSSQWLRAESWDRIRPGMSELEVVEILGPPTQLRREGETVRILLYAMELGASGFLGGSITFRNRKVTEVQRPVLK